MTTAVVTGSNGGIGHLVVERFLDRGFDVVGVDRGPGADGMPDTFNSVTWDLSAVDSIGELVDALPAVDVLVNNAGVMHTLPHDSYPAEKRRLTLAVNVETPVALMSALGSGMAERGSGRIVNTGSIAGQIGHPDVWYGITKAGIINATKSFARILGPSGVIVNAVAPGPVATAMLDSIPEERKEAIKASVHSGRFAQPEEIADAIVWLATDAPAYINGVCLDINNGAFPR